MGKALDIDLYKNGFDVRYIDCIQGPIAAASGYFNHEYYFYYCFLHSILGNKYNYFRTDISEHANNILDGMGLRLEKINCSSYSFDEVLLRITEEIQAGRPVIMVVKYNSLFYSMYYKNSSFTANHGIIVNEFNEVNSTFGIKEATLLRDSIDAFENRDVFFSLHITYDMLKAIWADSNQQFRYEKAFFEDSIYSLRKIAEVELNMNKVLGMALSMLRSNENGLIGEINAFQGQKSFSDFITVKRLRFSGCLKPIFSLLYKQCDHLKRHKAPAENLEEKLGVIRDKALNILNRASHRREAISPERKAELISLVEEGDRLLVELVESLVVDESGRKQTDHFIDISKLYNNQAFEEELRDSSTADITGEGTHYIFKDVVVNRAWKKGEYCFHYSYSPGSKDNISCSGQEIRVDSIKATHLSILGCAEYGNYNEEIVIEYEDGSKYNVKADFSDFFQPPVFLENVYWAGEAAVRKNGKTIYQSFNSRLFAKKYSIEPGIISRLILPRCKNVHIFAMTLSLEEWS